VDHLRYGLELLNRWSRGKKPFEDARYADSWTRTMVAEAEWASRREALRREAYSWREAMSQPRALDAEASAAYVSSVVHLAYHVGAIRQIDRAARGPSAHD
jgi:hypothetical protein